MGDKNRCSGCEYYDGFYKDSVRCDRGVKALISVGCNQFTPDDTANCHTCYYNDHEIKAFDITCSKYGFIKGQRKRCDGFAEKWGDSGDNKKGGCFLTTAVCEVLGKSDNCYELETLRNFRDEVLLKDPELASLVYLYYKKSPSIAEKILLHTDNTHFAQSLLDFHITPVINSINLHKKYEAVHLYNEMIKHIQTNLN